MPSDDRLRLALDTVAGQIAGYRSAVTAAEQRIRGMLAVGAGGDRARVELGAFGAHRIDPERFADLARGVVLDATTRTAVARAAEVLREVADLPETAYVVSVPAGDSAAARVDSALSQFGRVFGAARTIDLVRARQFESITSELALRRGFDRWTTAERAAAPPIVLVVNGADLNAPELGNFMDGSLHLMIVVDGACPPAALTRLITPGTFIAQTTDARGLDQFSAFSGPAVAALVDENAACFTHDPRRGTTPWQRIEIWKQPTTVQRQRIGGLSSRQQREDVAQLMAIATQPALSVSPLGDLVPMGADQVERLTDWLLAESGLSGSGAS